MSVGKKESETVEVETCLSTAVPAYLRFDAVKLGYESLESCEQMKLHLTHFKNALIGSEFSIQCRFEYDENVKESSVFLEHFLKEILPITGTGQSYEFEMDVSDRLYNR